MTALRRARAAAALLLAAAAGLAACKGDAPGAAPVASAEPRAAAGPRIAWRPAPPGDVAALVQEELARAETEGRTVLVYVGAAWCEPCQRFHAAAVAGELDARVPPLRLLEFDLDRDRDRLAQAGYASRMIPLFARPQPDGRASADRIEGAVKGDAAVGVILPRLLALLQKP